jgi:DNA-binding CsgD family transcriptional regulator
MGVTREIAAGQQGSWGTWIGSLFRYRQPQLGFSRSEQRLLFSALDGSTDGELSDKLGLSLTTVKKTWRSIYDRTAAHIPELVHGHSRDEKASPERGKAKKQYLIAYLREHPEELRPVSRKVLWRKTRREQSSRGKPSDS